MLTLSFWGADGLMITPETLTSGMVGAKIAFQYSEDWEGLNKTAVFMAGNTIRAVSNIEDAAEIPAEVLAAPGSRLYVGIYGESEDGTLVIPTICVAGPKIQYGADPLQAPAGEPPVTSYARLLTMIGDLTELKTEAKDSLVAALNEVFADGSNGSSADTGGNSGSNSTQNVTNADVSSIKTVLGNIMTIIKAQTDSEGGVERPQGYNIDVSDLVMQNDTLIAALGSGDDSGGSGDDSGGSGGDTEDEGESSEGVTSINWHIVTVSGGDTISYGNPLAEPDNGYVVTSDTEHTAYNGSSLIAFPLIAEKTYSIRVSNNTGATVYYGLWVSTLNVEPVKGEITAVTDTIVKNLDAWGYAAANGYKDYTYTAGAGEYLMMNANSGGTLTITAEVTA